jgi:predicted deacylase
MRAWVRVEPEYIRVTFADQESRLVHYRLGHGERRVLIMSGVHGWEHGGVQTAYELLKRLVSMPLRGRVDILPVCNPLAYAAESRETPGSGQNMQLCFTAGPPHDLTTALSKAVSSLAEEAEMVVNLHSAGPARYLVHTIFYRPQDAELAASLGLSFAILPRPLDILKNHIANRLREDQRTVTLELGGGMMAYPEDVTLGVEAVLALLGRSGFLGPGDYERPPTPPELVYMHDARLFVRAPSEGAFYAQARLATDFSSGEPFGFWVPLDGLQPQPVPAPSDGKLIYLRTRNRVSEGQTLAMFLPPQQGI